MDFPIGGTGSPIFVSMSIRGGYVVYFARREYVLVPKYVTWKCYSLFVPWIQQGTTFSHPITLCSYSKEAAAPRQVACTWAQRKDRLYLTIEITDCSKPQIKLEPDGALLFRGCGGSEQALCELRLQLFGQVDPEVCFGWATFSAICSWTSTWFSFKPQSWIKLYVTGVDYVLHDQSLEGHVPR